MKVAVVGCCHGLLDAIYRAVPAQTKLLIICGDFQALRNLSDLETISVPRKYRHLGDFHKYYTGEKTAPVLTVFVGGNHECSSYLDELKYGGWVAKNIFYLGQFGAVVYRGIRIAGISGIYNESSFRKNEPDPRLPYTDSTLRSAYHIRPKTFVKASFLEDIDVFISHDWPLEITKWGDVNSLLRSKPFFRLDIEKGQLGSPVNQLLLEKLMPRHWFSAHLHVKFEALVRLGHRNEEEIEISMEDESESSTVAKETRFLALDKCMPKRKFFAVVNIKSASADHALYLDKRAIAINKVIENYQPSLSKFASTEILDLEKRQPQLHQEMAHAIEKEYHRLNQEPERHFLASNLKFRQLAPGGPVAPGLKSYPNNQTTEYVERYGIRSQRATQELS
ncbi:hypothetical protein QFC19_005323 [Naganishia cerealis]|uniref:Uncharacterized protein n=1 Tax=Naganishia cerealis TaxID=610337 RepID=A0ACC2VR10_9TREE|nr:hypothetical protein QFC19_005323 [Naganishia cerealis]